MRVSANDSIAYGESVSLRLLTRSSIFLGLETPRAQPATMKHHP